MNLGVSIKLRPAPPFASFRLEHLSEMQRMKQTTGHGMECKITVVLLFVWIITKQDLGGIQLTKQGFLL